MAGNLSERQPLVSVLIPCYNGAKWIRDALDSCFKQTYKNIEIVVIDDGSTDDSLDILKSYGSEIKLETGPNRGLSAAQNRGLALSHGAYIQYLDADDYLLPEKIEHQLAYLEETGADGVYGDWRHQYHEADGTIHLGEIVLSGHQADLLESLLSGWWVPSMVLLHRRETVIRSGGWDETLKAQNDHDFLIAIAMTSTDVRYQPGCFSIYRRYGNVTMSTADLPRWLASEQRALEKAEAKLAESGRLSISYRQAMAKSYFYIARNYYGIDRLKYKQLLDKTLSLAPDFSPRESSAYNLVWRAFGFSVAERLASYKRHVGLRR
jgi:glycosyltransferase involved in cell wall biosynthesis